MKTCTFQQLTQAIKGKAKGNPYWWLSLGFAAFMALGSKKPARDILLVNWAVFFSILFLFSFTLFSTIMMYKDGQNF